MKRLGIGLLLAGMSLSSLACQRPGPPPETHSSVGVIRSFESNGKVLEIKHEAFPNFMDAMTMKFELDKPGMADGLKVGDRVEFTIERRENGWPVTRIRKL